MMCRMALCRDSYCNFCHPMSKILHKESLVFLNYLPADSGGTKKDFHVHEVLIKCGWGVLLVPNSQSQYIK